MEAPPPQPTSSNNTHDFEIINPVEASTNIPANPTPTPANEDARSIKDLFDQPTEPQVIQTLAKTGIFLFLPHQITWSVATAIFVALCQPTPDEETPVDQLVFKQIQLHTEDRLSQTKKRLEWVDRELPGVVERYNSHVSGAVQQVKTAKNEAFVTAAPFVAKSSHIALYIVAVPILLSFFSPFFLWFRLPIWIWLGLGYWIGKRRERWSQDRGQGRFARQFDGRGW